ncbi:hypothetical protein HYPSUDRAFT_160669 [Hypholoma sublateritium FD-334 SS-4]|uniref:HMG box domain-containing protein n=1 Tax=Hypholoma sublateritium (strain FD-334 SS-4) TaxID=945553 RepID=A0A0D2P3N7_HYPSF|nr:hypothetical protein HYPSUDRAFT_160669 [Hypholoma sublateritium FD-334 SS-4]
MPSFRNVHYNHQSGRATRDLSDVCNDDRRHVAAPYDRPVKLEPTEDFVHPAPSSHSPLALSSATLSDVHVGSVPPSPPAVEHKFESLSVSPAPPVRNKKSHSRRREAGYVPRPRNSFIVFRSYWIEEQKGSGEGQQNELSKQAGKAWKAMSPAQKQKYKEIANQEQQRHKIEHPNYQYTPTPRHTLSASRSRSKAPAKKAGGASAGSRKRKAADTYSSASPATTAEPESPDVIPAARNARVPRAAAQMAVHRLEQIASESLPSVSPQTPQIPLALCHSPAMQEAAPQHSPIAEEEEEFVPYEDIPHLALDPLPRTEDVEMTMESKPGEPTFCADYPPSLVYTGEQFGLKSTFTDPYAHVPTIPNVKFDEIPYLNSELQQLNFGYDVDMSASYPGYLHCQPLASELDDHLNNSFEFDAWLTMD